MMNSFCIAGLARTAHASSPAAQARTGAGWRRRGRSSLSRCITTLPSKRTTSPFSVIRSLSAVSVPLVSLTSTGSSEETVPLPMSTKA